MPDYDTTLQLCDKEAAPQGIRPLSCLPGRCAVLMHKGESRGGILLPLSGRLNPDMGTVVDSDCDGLLLGSEVIVKPYDGLWLDRWHEDRQLRLYGVVVPWHHSILAVRTPLGIEPVWDWVLVKRDDVENHHLLPDKMRCSKSHGSIHAIGPRCEALPPHARVLFSSDAFEPGAKNAFVFWGGDPSLVLVKERHILAVIESD